MKAAHVHEYGPNSRFTIAEVDKPTVKPREVLVKVEASGIIFADVLDIRGSHGPWGVPFPYIMGWEVAGTVDQVGDEVTGFTVGQRVAGTMKLGGFAEYAPVSVDALRPIPARCSAQQAMVYLINLPVAYLHYNTYGQVKPGETILVHGAAGGVGSMLIQIAKKCGANVIALASTDEKLEFCKQLGADHTINYRTTDYVKAVRQITDKQGVDVVFNGVAGPSMETDPKIIKRLTGRWVIIGRAAGLGMINPWTFIMNSITVRPCSVMTLDGTEDQRASRRFLDEWLRNEPLIEPGHVFKLEDINEAFDLLEHQRSHGKVVLVP